MKDGKYKLIDEYDHTVVVVSNGEAVCVEAEGESGWSVGDVEPVSELEISEWVSIESQLQPRKTVSAHDCVLSGNKVVGINEGTQAEGNGVTDDTEAVQAMLDKSQPRKTVSDAVDYFDGVWPDDALGVICFDDEYGWRCWKANWIGYQKFYQVCTREEFEAEVERRKGEEVFRLIGSSDLVKVVYEGRDGIVCVANEDNDIFVAKKEDLRKRKPIISKAEADAVKAFFSWAEKRPCVVLRVDDYLEQFEVK